ncbi:DUF5017 domain-containing protein [Paraflavitalea sp. CAU 1676]|uniref:DUF5017 domain-containing protein n=1 Tax=Paraflavitalea sp. CAU 1676 TaxID=3032598 RepID=UPI0023DCDBFC|nr:DUF5017 domain-containing protein [Paraflavitalea sp. CAU 1676]MDF2192704.1 DUF5017 domain-containing protein [Paraflavitalea sp. CAU 1676]
MNKLFPYIICSLLLASCSKRDEVDTPVFEVAANGSTFKLGDSIIFTFTGTPQNIVFWPGTPGRVYEFRERTFTTGNKLLVKFNTYQQFGVRNNMTVLVSNDFNGVYDTTNVKAATWTDVTSRFTLSTGADQTQSGTVDLSEFANNNKAATLAFRYVTPALAGPNRWVVRTFNADNQSPDGAITPMATMSTAAWKAISFANPASNWSITSSQLLSQATANNADDDWVLSKSFNPNTATPDKGIAIKNITTNLTRYAPATDLFNKAGTYKVVFEASNASYQNMPARVLKELTITITP